MLVLAATYNAELTSLTTGKPLVETNELKSLFTRTIRFLKFSEAISPTLERDAKILEHVQQTLFEPQRSRFRGQTELHLQPKSADIPA
jgi:hypothetical protein